MIQIGRKTVTYFYLKAQNLDEIMEAHPAPVEVSSLSHYLQALYIPGGCFGFLSQMSPRIANLRFCVQSLVGRKGLLAWTLSRNPVIDIVWESLRYHHRVGSIQKQTTREAVEYESS